MSNKVYDTLKYVCMIALPAVGAFYFALAKIWDLPYSAEVGGTITALCTFIGALLGISSIKYNKNNGK